MKPRLLFFCSDYEVGLTQALTEQVVELNHEKEIALSCVSSEKEQEPGLHQRVRDCGGDMTIIPNLDVHKNFKALATTIDHIIKEKNITHVNVHNNWQLALVAYIKYCHWRQRKFKIIYTIHGYRHNSPIKTIPAILMIGTALMLFADRVISMSSYVSKRFLFVKYKTDIVFYMMNQPQYEKKENHLDGAPLCLVFPAQFRKGKRQEMLVEALRLYVDKTGDHSIKMYLPGDGPLRENVMQMANNWGLKENVIFPGKMPLREILALYEQCNVALVSSNVETYGRCIAEPFMLGRCLLTQKTGVAFDIIRDGKNGMFFTDAQNLASILEELYNHPEKVVAMGQQAFEDRKVFFRDAVMQSYLSVIHKA